MPDTRHPASGTQLVFIGLHTPEFGTRGLQVYETSGPACLRWNGTSDELPALVRRRGAVPLAPRLDLARHDPAGFACGAARGGTEDDCRGAGASQLALALAVAVYGAAKGGQPRFYHALKRRCVAGLPADRHWLLPEREVRLVMADLAPPAEAMAS